MTKLKVFSTFTGIGGFELGLTQALGEENLEFVGYSEIDKYANSVYNFHFPNHINYGDIITLNTGTISDFDLLVGGSPCQDLSISGRRAGFAGAKSSLFFEYIRILEDKKPSYFIWENVKGAFSSNGGKDWLAVVQNFTEAGYDIQWSIHNTKNYGCPQNRERVYVIGHLRGLSLPQVLPLRGDNSKTIKELTTRASQGNRIYDPSGVGVTLSANGGGLGAKMGLYSVGAMRGRYNEEGDIEQQLEIKEPIFVKEGRSEEGKEIRRKNRKELGIDSNPFRAKETQLVPQLFSNTLTSVQKDNLILSGFVVQDGEIRPKDISNCIDANYHKGLDNHGARTGVIAYNNKRKHTNISEISNTLTSSFRGYPDGDGRPAVISFDDFKIRRLTPTECEKLQGFPFGHTAKGLNEKGQVVDISDSQRYKMCGNAVSVPVVKYIIETLFKNSL